MKKPARSSGHVLSFLMFIGLTSCASQRVAPSIEEAMFVRIGGIEQWVTIRGANRANPPLLIVHGGPGDAQSSLLGAYAPYEKEFVVVQWDQRGAGQTFARNSEATKALSLERMAADGIELSEYLLPHLGKKKLIVLGHSWGTILATRMVQNRPELFAAYVGTGQVASWKTSVAVQWNYLKTRAEAAKDRPLLESMRAIGTPDPFDIAQYFSWRTPLIRKYLGRADTQWLEGLRALAGMTETDVKAISEGENFSALALLKTVMETDLEATASRMPIPFFVIQGHEDVYTPTDAAVQYFNKVRAPKKSFVVIEDAGHFAMTTHSDQFLKALMKVKL